MSEHVDGCQNKAAAGSYFPVIFKVMFLLAVDCLFVCLARLLKNL